MRRTASGIANLHLFLRVDRIVYCEGGARTLTVDQILAGEGDEETLDVFFWQTLFETFGSNLRTHFKSVGSKQALLSIASLVVADDIANVVVCLDRDFDTYRQATLMHGGVLYTRGYSWENDALSCIPTLEAVFYSYRNRTDAAAAVWQRFRASLDRFFADNCRFATYDLHFISCSKPGMYPRDHVASVLSLHATDMPTLDLQRLKNMLTQRGYKRGPRPRERITRASVAQDMFGKLLARFVYHAMRMAVGPQQGGFPQISGFTRMAIVRFGDVLRHGAAPELQAYYERIIS